VRGPRYRFTIGQLIKLIAALAVLFTVLRTPFWPLVVGIGMILAGFARDRAKGGAGFFGAMVAGTIGFPCVGVAFYVCLQLLDQSHSFDFPGLVVLGFYGGVIGWAVGTVVGYWTWMIIDHFGKVIRPRVGAQGRIAPIVWRGFEDRGLQHPGTGGQRP
jgi:hypothetical protein